MPESPVPPSYEELAALVAVQSVQLAEQATLIEAMRIELLEARHNAYYWIRIHTGVEAEHFDAALRGSNKALLYYAGPNEPAQVKDWILEGFSRFASVQADFMTALGEA